MAIGSNVASGILVGGELNTLLTDSATALVLQSGQIATRFPAIPTDGYYYLVLIDTNVTAPTDPLDRVEVVKATAIASDTFTIVRGSYEGTTPKQFPITSSDPVENVVVRLAHTVEQIKELIHDYLEFDEQASVPDTPLATQIKTFAMPAGTGSAIFSIDDAAMIAPLLGGAVATDAATNPTFTSTSPRFNIVTAAALRTITLDGTDMKMPAAFFFYNADPVQGFLIKAGTDYYKLLGHEWVLFMAIQDAPTTGAHWAKMGGSQKIRVFTELTQTFTTTHAAETLSLGTNDGLADSVVGEYDKAFYVSTDGTLPSGFAASTPYYIVNAGASTCQLSLTPNGAAVEISDDGSGTHTLTPQWLPPLGVGRVDADLYGAGGGGAGRNAGTNSGGGGGAAERRLGFLPVTPATALSVTIAPGGAGGTSTNDGSAGGNSSFSTITANGANGGISTSTTSVKVAGQGGVGGTGGSGGDNSFDGEPGNHAVDTTLAGNGGSTDKGPGGSASPGSLGNGGSADSFGGGAAGGRATGSSGTGGTGGRGGLLLAY